MSKIESSEEPPDEVMEELWAIKRQISSEYSSVGDLADELMRKQAAIPNLVTVEESRARALLNKQAS